MKKLSLVMALCAVLAAPAFANDDHHATAGGEEHAAEGAAAHGKKKKAAPAKKAGKMHSKKAAAHGEGEAPAEHTESAHH